MSAQYCKVVLIQEHTHCGKQYFKDTPLLVTQAEAAWMVKHNVARREQKQRARRPK